MLTILSILIFLACCLLVLAVLIQNPKGGGLASGFQSGAQVMGVRRTADFLEKATWGLAVGVLLMCVLSTTMMMNGGEGTTEAETSTTKDKASDLDGQPAGTGGALPLPSGNAPAPPAH
jgi:preprotein translocase subunit SecG